MSIQVKRILVATDFSYCSEPAFEYALRWAEGWNAQLDIVHVVEFHPGLDAEAAVPHLYLEEQQAAAAPKLARLVAKARVSVPMVTPHQTTGIPSEQINQVALECEVDVVIVGTHGWTGLNRLLLGSTAEQIVRHAPCPVITVRGEQAQEAEAAEAAKGAAPEGSPPPRVSHAVLPQKILVPLDFSDCSLDAFEYAVAVAKQFKAEVILLHVDEPPSYSLDFNLTHLEAENRKQEEMETRIRGLTGLLQSEGLAAQFLLKMPPHAHAIVDALESTQADLIIMGTHGRHGLSRLLLGSVATAVLRQSPVPVMSVKSPKYPKGHPPKSEQAEDRGTGASA